MRNKFEETIADELPNYSYEGETLSYIKPETTHKYIPDFIIQKKVGGKMYIETKGFWTITDRKKILLIVQQYPELDIRMLFQRASNTISKKSNTTYGEWCTKNGIVWADKTVPNIWIGEMR